MIWAIQSPGPEELYKNAIATELGLVQTDEDIAERLEDKEAKASRPQGGFSSCPAPIGDQKQRLEKPCIAAVDHAWWLSVVREQESVQDSPRD